MRTVAELEDFEIGVMFWAGGDPDETLAVLKNLGVRCGQMGVPGHLDLSCSAAWKKALGAADFTVTTVFAAYTGENYADKPTVARTVGFIPRQTRAEREKRTLEVSDFAAVLGVSSIATHIGCVPEERDDADHREVQSMVQRTCEYAARNDQRFALETGQESAKVLLRFLEDANQSNLGINFDPANMILYGTEDPIPALETLAGRIFSVHCKDGDWPAAGQPDALGVERLLGAGAVRMGRFLEHLRRTGYRGPLMVEREAENPDERLRDLSSGIELIRNLKRDII